MPYSMVQHMNASRWAHDRRLTNDMLIPCYLEFMYLTQMTTRQQHGSTHFDRSIMRKIHDLNVEIRSWVDSRIRMPRLCRSMTRAHAMQSMMVMTWTRPNQTRNNSPHLGKSKYFANRMLTWPEISRCIAGISTAADAALSDTRHNRLIHGFGHHSGKGQYSLGYERRHGFSIEQVACVAQFLPFVTSQQMFCIDRMLIVIRRMAQT